MQHLGDFWPNVLEDSIKEIEMEQQKAMQQQMLDSSKSEANMSGNLDEDSLGNGFETICLITHFC